MHLLKQENPFILLVDYYPAIAARLAVLLDEAGIRWPLKGATSAAAALETINRQLPLLVIMDIGLPGKTGISLLHHIKTAWPAIPVIVLSNDTGSRYRDICLEGGASYFLDKSLEFDQLPPLVSRLVAP